MTMSVQANANGGAALDGSKSNTVEDGWKLVWNDEFDGNALDTTKWSCQIGNGYNGWGNQESQYYTAENVSVADGTLKITAKKEKKGGFDYTSSRIRTVTDDGQTLFSTKYGKVEARIKLPSGTGLWPAFWMMPVNSEYGSWPLSGEIDIMEARGRELDTVHGTIHFGEKRPFNKNIGSSYTFNDGSNITDY
ncbi:MAG: glycoside hydrolase family 16 protein, partial [Lachnospiraceae bacterium]|nr:glycoside hydrolase family 16 protein [Lachnospiraceae bacterium]